MPESISAPVIGPSTILPRGYLWLAPLWYTIATAGLALTRWLPVWFRLDAAAGLILAMVTFLVVIASVSVHGFAADESGVRLGLPSQSRRRGRRRREIKNLPWQQIERVRIAPSRDGARLQFLLRENATYAVRGFDHGFYWRAARWLLLLIPAWYLLRPTGLTSPRAKPSRYEIRVRGVRPDELRHAIRALAPADVAVAVLVRRG
ncbi:MAG TPA: hypothetical protein VNF47_06040 [Streptosporangiaceae bacterium]|nr:hypothetical protein [Streptosporangiaceae bacterium]